MEQGDTADRDGRVRPCPVCQHPFRLVDWEHAGVESYCVITCPVCKHRDRFGPV